MRIQILLSTAFILGACGDKEAGADAGTASTDGSDGADGGGDGADGGDGGDGGDGADGGDGGDGGDGADGGDGGDPDADGDGSPASEDCDDNNADIYPYADEYCDGVDNDCDGDVDESTAVDAQPWYLDEDGDGYGDEVETVACDQPEGTVAVGGDCDDDNVDYHPDAAEDDCTDPEDYNCDGVVAYADEDGDGWAACEDCDDDEPAVHPDVSEVCDGIDNDCDGLVDDADDSVDLTTRREFWPDTDGDTYGDTAATVTLACSAPAAHVENNDDCDDGDIAINPAATEVCDAADVDEDCNGVADDSDSGVLGSSLTEWFQDADGDSYGAGTSTLACDSPGSTWILVDGDCDDGDSAIHPGATEICDADDVDEDCNSLSDDDDTGVDTSTQSTWYADADEDGHGDPAGATVSACDDPSATTVYANNANDCDDGDPAISPDADEVCDASDVDEDCNGLSDDDDSGLLASSASEFYPDSDGDGYGDASGAVAACDDPDGTGASWISDNTDCDDGDSAVNPGATEICDDLDNDCDASTTGAGTVSYDSGSGVLTDVSASFGGTVSSVASVTLSSGTYYFCDDTFYASMTASSGLSVELVGSGSAVLSGATTDSIVRSTGADVSVRDLTIEEGYAASYGGGIFCNSSGSLTLNNVVLQDNDSGYYGGALYSDTCEVVVNDSTFDGNDASAHGGAFWVEDANTSLDNVDITDNYAYYRGAGGSAYRGDLDATDTVWDGNTNAYTSTTASAAALAVTAGNFTCTYVTRGGFTNNIAAATYGTGGMNFSPSTGDMLYNYGCDWGSSAAGNDNVYYDLYWENSNYWGSNYPYTIDNTLDFACDDTTGCYLIY